MKTAANNKIQVVMESEQIWESTPALCGDRNKNKVILTKITTDGNLTLTKRLIKKILYLHN
jgi:hypothetical protein